MHMKDQINNYFLFSSRNATVLTAQISQATKLLGIFETYLLGQQKILI